MKKLDEFKKSEHEKFVELKQDLKNEIYQQVSKNTSKVLNQVHKTDKIVEDINRLVFQRNYWLFFKKGAKIFMLIFSGLASL